MGTAKQKDVAKATGLSVAAVSRALAGHPNISAATRQRVRDASRKLGYRRSSPVKKTIALACVQRYAMRDSRFDSLPALALARSAANRGISIQLCHQIEEVSDRKILAALLEIADQADGLLLYGHLNATTLRGLRKYQVPYVVLGPPEGGVDTLPPGGVAVTTNMIEAGRLATGRLIERGHARIAFFCPDRPIGLYYDSWLAGYQLAHVRAGLTVDPDLVYIHAERNPNPPDGTVAAAACDWYEQLKPPPSAWVIPDLIDFADLLSLAPRRGLQLSSENLTLGGRRTGLINIFLAGWPMVAEDIDAMLDAACGTLRMMITGQPQATSEIVIPFQLHEVDSPPAPVGDEQWRDNAKQKGKS